MQVKQEVSEIRNKMCGQKIVRGLQSGKIF